MEVSLPAEQVAEMRGERDLAQQRVAALEERVAELRRESEESAAASREREDQLRRELKESAAASREREDQLRREHEESAAGLRRELEESAAVLRRERDEFLQRAVSAEATVVTLWRVLSRTPLRRRRGV
ncbi:hypothetical protein LOZ12_001035 [Ophidiomyces ophidiicola]|uniref:Uncharacterized protein n=1 Tax=Ophidiomyces ophidiicola TaxID=1387563 RepID=A0ACB8V493_9EURO|nr:uncharacterized protein LOZ57_001700 [Ophidiomyces ophidiicola]KAI1914002.1 hypothetical protein LOZ61_002420 [Ophidiomyces ophidiicola]KAI1921497.1 hypothetical protein LOZ64_001478 [Ophidiomyces ophidiicola]KAI1929505.1 hypothetical protein LOZ60_001526 [Ophidiomyces ophidiicola]KAI1948921.1 hypothetical protein LOZ62_002433 [Ophidiomyces ophidiicola]KAI1951147.1 hypothetical protein LOZ57_001700 [Ophidiomyces ophidiicola]